MFSLRWFIVRHFLCRLKGRKTGKSPMEGFFFSFLLLSHEHDLNWGKRGLFELTWWSVANVIDCLESDLLFSCCFFVSSCFSKSYHLLCWYSASMQQCMQDWSALCFFKLVKPDEPTAPEGYAIFRARYNAQERGKIHGRMTSHNLNYLFKYHI